MEIESPEPIFYYNQLVFRQLLDQHRARIFGALHEDPKDLRRRALMPHLQPGEILSGQEAWDIFFDYLSVVEDELKSIIEQHSVYYWLHLYRRIGVKLSPYHEGNKDDITLALVREIGELAISKHGRLLANDLHPCGRVHFKNLLGGYAKRVWTRRFSEKRAQRLFAGVKDSNQWVLTDFKLSDFVDVFRIEGLSYEYWRGTALLRGVGKGDAIKPQEDDWPEYIRSNVQEKLLRIYDDRARNAVFNISLLGSWFDVYRNARSDLAVVPSFNVSGHSGWPFLQKTGFHADTRFSYKPNFVPSVIDIGGFYSAHKYLDGAFLETHGLGLHAICTTLWGVALLAFNQPEKMREQVPLSQQDGLSLMNFMQRGYSISALSLRQNAEIIAESAKIANLAIPAPSLDEIELSLQFLVLSADGQKQIGLWSGGRRFPVVEIPDGFLFNSEGIADLLQRLFFRIQYNQSERGSLFEASFRDGLARRGVKIEAAGVIRANDGEREIDASVRVGNELVLFECCSVERPLDFEIGRPKTIDYRKKRLDEKIDQVFSLRDFIVISPRGRNYDFSWAESITCVVVSPFLEWIWDTSDRLWLEPDKQPRILEASEAMDWIVSKLTSNHH